MTRVFVIYAADDYRHFERLSEQARSAKLAVEFDRVQAKQPWVSGWKGGVRTKVFQCDGAIVLISKKTSQGGIAWEMECARTIGIPVLGVHVDKHERGALPEGLTAAEAIEWNWPDIARFIQSLAKGSSASMATSQPGH
jgi:hypothetical protein